MRNVKKYVFVLLIGMSFIPSALALETPAEGSKLGQLPQGRVGAGAWKCQLSEDHNSLSVAGARVAKPAQAPVQAQGGNMAISGG